MGKSEPPHGGQRKCAVLFLFISLLVIAAALFLTSDLFCEILYNADVVLNSETIDTSDSLHAEYFELRSETGGYDSFALVYDEAYLETYSLAGDLAEYLNLHDSVTTLVFGFSPDTASAVSSYLLYPDVDTFGCMLASASEEGFGTAGFAALAEKISTDNATLAPSYKMSAGSSASTGIAAHGALLCGFENDDGESSVLTFYIVNAGKKPTDAIFLPFAGENTVILLVNADKTAFSSAYADFIGRLTGKTPAVREKTKGLGKFYFIIINGTEDSAYED